MDTCRPLCQHCLGANHVRYWLELYTEHNWQIEPLLPMRFLNLTWVHHQSATWSVSYFMYCLIFINGLNFNFTIYTRQSIPAIFARAPIHGIKAMSCGISQGKQVIKFANTSNCSRVCLFYQNKMIISLSCKIKCTYRVFAIKIYVIFSVCHEDIYRCFFAYKKVTLITSTHILTLVSLRWQGCHCLLSRINKLNHDFLHWQFFYLCAPWETTWYHFYPISPQVHANMAGIMNNVYSFHHKRYVPW